MTQGIQIRASDPMHEFSAKISTFTVRIKYPTIGLLHALRKMTLFTAWLDVPRDPNLQTSPLIVRFGTWGGEVKGQFDQIMTT
ncbi:hypothetical protein CEE58_18680 [Stenotrophomonas maltophilia]|nr:hypothetical protein CEE58_18680 [Stenotrophomonas maltophilia]